MTLRSVGGSLGFLRIIDETSKETPSTQALSHHGSLSSELTALRAKNLPTEVQVNSEHCLNVPLLRCGTTGQFTKSFTGFRHKLSRGGIQQRADTGPCGFGIELNEKHTEYFSCFTSSLFLPGKGQAP